LGLVNQRPITAKGRFSGLNKQDYPAFVILASFDHRGVFPVSLTRCVWP